MKGHICPLLSHTFGSFVLSNHLVAMSSPSTLICEVCAAVSCERLHPQPFSQIPRAALLRSAPLCPETPFQGLRAVLCRETGAMGRRADAPKSEPLPFILFQILTEQICTQVIHKQHPDPDSSVKIQSPRE